MMTITMMITMSMTMLLPAAAVFVLIVRRSQYKNLAFRWISKQKLKSGCTVLAKSNGHHGVCVTSAKISPKQNTTNTNMETRGGKTVSYP